MGGGGGGGTSSLRVDSAKVLDFYLVLQFDCLFPHTK